MAVYVDNMLRPARVGRITSRWSHLIADTSEELHAFAAQLGMRREWVQYPGTHREHYDLTAPRRDKAIALGAEQITYPHGTAEVLARKREAAKAPTCPTECVTANHPGREHEQWVESCRVVALPDGTPIRVMGGEPMTDEDMGHLAEIVAAAKRRYESEQEPTP